MLKSSNLESIITTVNEVTTIDVAGSSIDTTNASTSNQRTSASIPTAATTTAAATTSSARALSGDELQHSIASLQLSAGVLNIIQPPIEKVRKQFKELIAKQNKIYIDLSTEKYKLDNAEMAKLYAMMNDVKLYREKLVRIKKLMQNVYQRGKVLKKRAANIQASKQKELQRKLQKQQQEESLIGKQQQQQQTEEK